MFGWSDRNNISLTLSSPTDCILGGICSKFLIQVCPMFYYHTASIHGKKASIFLVCCLLCYISGHTKSGIVSRLISRVNFHWGNLYLLFHVHSNARECKSMPSVGWLLRLLHKKELCINRSLLFCIGTSKVQMSLCVAGRCLLGVAPKTWLPMSSVSFFRSMEKWLMSSSPNLSEHLPLLRLLMIRYPSKVP